MWSVTGIVVAFLLVVVLVIALARSTTARWEREERAARARRRRAAAAARAAAGPGTSGGAHGAADRLRGAVLRAAAPGVRAVRTPLSASARILSTARSRVVPHHRLTPRVRHAPRPAAEETLPQQRPAAESGTATGRRRSRLTARRRARHADGVAPTGEARVPSAAHDGADPRAAQPGAGG